MVAVCIDYLRSVGIEWSAHPTEEEARREYERVWTKIGHRAIEDLVDLPLMSDLTSLGTLDVLTKFLGPVAYTDPNLVSLTACRAINLSLEQGNSDGSCVAYVWLGRIAGPHFGDYKAGFRIGQLGYELAGKSGLERFKAPTYLWFAQFVVPWMKHVRSSRELMRGAFEVAGKAGDITTQSYCFDNLNTNFLAAADEPASGVTSTIGTPVEQLDLAAVMKVSHAVSEEIVLEQLIKTLMVIAIEHAGAQRGLLILPFDEEYRIVAEAKTGADQVEVQVQQAAVGPSDLPDSLLRYVLRTQESVILDDASNQPQSRQLIRHGPADVGRGGNPAEMSESLFTEGEYVRQRRPKSILCLPLVKQARLMGVLYLETSEKNRDPL